MPEFVNNLDHPVRVANDQGESVKVRPGQVINADGAFADNLKAIDGVDEATDEDREAWENRDPTVSDITSGKVSLEQELSDARVRGRVASIAVPLNQVIGDDNAPIGPPSGTITTKQAVARIGPVEKRAFADHERLPEEAGNERLNEVERVQAELKGVVEDVHNEALEAAAEAGLEGATLEPTSEGSLSGEGRVATGDDDDSDSSSDQPLRGQALDDALNEKGLSTSGTVAEKQQRLADAK
jgi:hypothetical protein